MIYPKHVAIIPDGNRTWAKENNKSIPEAYWISYNRGVELAAYTFDHTDCKVFTLWGLSTENANKRPKEEYDFLMNMYKEMDQGLDDILIRNQVNFKRIGNPNGVSEGFRNYLNERQERLKFDTDKYLVFGVNYGGRDELIRAVHHLADQGKDMKTITEEDISKACELGNVSPIELVIRTKGDQAQRTSGLMSRWIGYAELYFTAKRCPEFDTEDFKEALVWFDKMAEKRNYGK